MSENEGKPPEVLIEEGATLEDMKKSVYAIEGLFFAIDRASFPLAVYDRMMMGMSFLKAVHDGILKKMGPEEIEKIRKSEQFKSGAQPPEGAA